MTQTRFGKLLLAAVLVLGLAACAQAGQTKIAISHTASLESPWHKASLIFAEYVNSRAGDRYKIEVFGNGALCQRNWKVMFEMTQAGDSQIGIESATTLGSLVSQIGAINLPFLFDNYDHVLKFLKSGCPIWEKWFKQNIQDQNLVILAAAPRPFRQINNNKRLIKTPEDIAGLRFRVPATPLFVKIFEALGAKPVPLPSGEIYTAIQLGTVVGEDNSISVQYDFKTHEVAKFFTIWNYIADASAFFINKDIWDAMTPADQKIFQEGADLWIKENAKFDEQQIADAMVGMKKAGVEFHTMTAAEKEPFKKLVKPVYDEFGKQVGADNLKQYMEYVEKTRN